MPDVTGVLLKATDCRAVVRLDRPEREAEFADQDCQNRQSRSRGSHVTSWAPTTVVEPVGFETLENEEHDMSKTATKKPGKSKARKAQSGKLSCIDAAAKVLGEKKSPMNTKEMIEAMAAKGYWSSPNGQTPAATLYSAILRELNAKGKDARFKKTERGKFARNG
jgi:hypothetical protein